MSRRGTALLVVVLVLAALGVISATALALGRAERSAGVLAVAEVQARGAADGAMAEALRGFASVAIPVIAGAESPLAVVSFPGPSVGRASLRALGDRVYAILASGERLDRNGRILATVRAELLVTVDSAGPDSLVRPRRYPRGWRLLP